MIEQIANSVICWSIILLALFCYQQMFYQYLMAKAEQSHNVNSVDTVAATHKHEFTSILIGALPLLGLLGTIVGLLDCFAGIASQGANSQLMSAGISDALLTTQLGLVCAVPGWLLQAWVKAKVQPKLHSVTQVLEQLTIESTAENRQRYAANKPGLQSKKQLNDTSIDLDTIEAA